MDSLGAVSQKVKKKKLTDSVYISADLPSSGGTIDNWKQESIVSPDDVLTCRNVY
jgi:hypothetical protein